MSNYVDNNLTKGETVVLKAQKNPLCLIGPILAFVIFLVLAIVVPILVEAALGEEIVTLILKIFFGIMCFATGLEFIRALIRYVSMDLAITNKRVVGKVGALKITSIDVPISKIDNVQIKATALGNLFKFYSLNIRSASGEASNSSREKFIGIKNAQEFKNTVTEAIERHAEEARKEQAAEIARAMGKKVF